MKTRFLLLSFFMLSASLLSRAAVVSVVNGDNLQTKITNATAGDVLIVGVGNYTSGNITINKKLTILGPGFFRTVGSAQVTNMYLVGGSSGSYISGMDILNDFYIGSSNNTITRNKISFQFILGYDNNAGNVSTINNKITQNYLGTTNSSSYASIHLGYSSGVIQNNYLISNNICLTKLRIEHANASSGLVINNIFDIDSTNTGSSGAGEVFAISGGINNVSFYNNVFKGGFPNTASYMFNPSNADYHPYVFKYNIIDKLTSGITLPADNLVTTAKIFGGYPTNTHGLNNADGRAVLSPGSPATTYGRKAPYASNSLVTEAGAFGGDQPYVLSGIPVGPQIYSMSVPSLAAANSVIPVTVKAKTNN
jgi:hypothetical protein